MANHDATTGPHRWIVHRFRYSLAMLLGATTIVAISIVALRTGDWLWARLLFNLTLTLNLAAILGAIYRTGRQRAFCIGFALFGWTCWSISSLSSLRIAEHQFFARQVYDWLREYAPEGNSGLVIDPNGSAIAVFSFRQIVFTVFSLLYSLVGGVLGFWLCRSEAR